MLPRRGDPREEQYYSNNGRSSSSNGRAARPLAPQQYVPLNQPHTITRGPAAPLPPPPPTNTTTSHSGATRSASSSSKPVSNGDRQQQQQQLLAAMAAAQQQQQGAAMAKESATLKAIHQVIGVEVKAKLRDATEGIRRQIEEEVKARLLANNINTSSTNGANNNGSTTSTSTSLSADDIDRIVNKVQQRYALEARQTRDLVAVVQKHIEDLSIRLEAGRHTASEQRHILDYLMTRQGAGAPDGGAGFGGGGMGGVGGGDGVSAGLSSLAWRLAEYGYAIMIAILRGGNSLLMPIVWTFYSLSIFSSAAGKGQEKRVREDGNPEVGRRRRDSGAVSSGRSNSVFDDLSDSSSNDDDEGNGGFEGKARGGGGGRGGDADGNAGETPYFNTCRLAFYAQSNSIKWRNEVVLLADDERENATTKATTTSAHKSANATAAARQGVGARRLVAAFDAAVLGNMAAAPPPPPPLPLEQQKTKATKEMTIAQGFYDAAVRRARQRALEQQTLLANRNTSSSREDSEKKGGEAAESFETINGIKSGGFDSKLSSRSSVTATSLSAGEKEVKSCQRRSQSEGSRSGWLGRIFGRNKKDKLVEATKDSGFNSDTEGNRSTTALPQTTPSALSARTHQTQATSRLPEVRGVEMPRTFPPSLSSRGDTSSYPPPPPPPTHASATAASNANLLEMLQRGYLDPK